MSRITRTLLGCWRIGSKDGITELSTGLILPQGRPDAAQTEEATKGRGGDGFEGLAT
jgi:hypothetical protein